MGQLETLLLQLRVGLARGHQAPQQPRPHAGRAGREAAAVTTARPDQDFSAAARAMEVNGGPAGTATRALHILAWFFGCGV